MKANELMIGDWARVTEKADKDYFFGEYKPGEIVQVREILDYGINPDWCGAEVNDVLHLEAIEPIPLTKEILEANGFKEYIPGLNLMYGLGGPYIASNEEGNQWVFGLVKRDKSARYPLVKITYVHEFQHALRLCGIDKEIIIK